MSTPESSAEFENTAKLEVMLANISAECFEGPLSDGLRRTFAPVHANPEARMDERQLTDIHTTVNAQYTLNNFYISPQRVRSMRTGKIVDREISLMRAAYPGQILEELVPMAKSVADVAKIVDTSQNDAATALDRFYETPNGQSDASRARAIMLRRIGDRLIALCSDNPQMFHDVEAEFLTNPEQTRRVIYPYVERALARKFGEDTIVAPEFITQAAGFCWNLEQAGLLLHEFENTAVLGHMKSLMHPQIAEILQYRLAHRPVETSARTERRSVWMARLLLKSVLDTYETDPTRDAYNTQAIKRTLFPDSTRPDSLSRNKLIDLSNRITTDMAAIHSLPAASLLSPSLHGVAGTALQRVLAITTAHSTPSHVEQSQRLQDKLYAEIFSMLLEQRKYKR